MQGLSSLVDFKVSVLAPSSGQWHSLAVTRLAFPEESYMVMEICRLLRLLICLSGRVSDVEPLGPKSQLLKFGDGIHSWLCAFLMTPYRRACKYTARSGLTGHCRKRGC